MNNTILTFVGHSGLRMNINGGYYRSGVAYNAKEKLRVARIYYELRSKDTNHVSSRQLGDRPVCRTATLARSSTS